MAARNSSHYLKQTGDSTVDDLAAQAAQAIQAQSVFYENLLLGMIDGFTIGFNDSCRSGLAQSVRSGFDILNNIAIYNPTKTAKFTIANNGFTEASNLVYAYCDTSALVANLRLLADYNNEEQYIVVASRVLGTLVNEFWKLKGCVDRGMERYNGYDVGYCSSSLASKLLDTSL